MSKKLTLRQQLTLTGIILGVSFIVSAALAAITAGVPPEDRTISPWFIGMIFGVVAGATYLGLTGNRKVGRATDAERDRALSPVTDGQARLLVVREGYVGKLAGVDVAIDGETRTQLRAPRFAAIDLAPGDHQVTATLRGRTSGPVTVTLAAGETAALSLTFRLGNNIEFRREDDLPSLAARLRMIEMVSE